MPTKEKYPLMVDCNFIRFDFDSVQKNWEDEQKKNPNTLKNFYETWMKMQRVAATAKHEEGDSEQEEEDEEDEVSLHFFRPWYDTYGALDSS